MLRHVSKLRRHALPHAHRERAVLHNFGHVNTIFPTNNLENANTTPADLKGKEGTSQNKMDAAAKRRRRAFKSLSRIMGRSEQFPVKFRNGMEGLIMELLVTLEELAHNLLCDNNGNDYKGLDINRDTEEQVEALYKVFPNALSKRSPFNG